MTSLQQRYTELLALTKIYLQQEHSLSDRILSESETYAYFKAYALQRQNAKTQQNTPAQTPVSPVQKIAAPLPAIPHIANLPKPVANLSVPSQQNIEMLKSDKPEFNKLVTNQEKNASSKSDQPENTAKKNPATEAFRLDPPTALPQTDFSALRTIINEKLPHVHLLDRLPDDTEAKKLANIWTLEKKTPNVLILSFGESPKHQAFLTNIAKALEVHGFDTMVASAAKLERENEWQKLLLSKELKLVVAGSSGFYNLPELQKHYREGTKQGRHYLGNRLLLLLSDISYYLKEPTLKPSLWAALKELLTNSSTPL